MDAHTLNFYLHTHVFSLSPLTEYIKGSLVNFDTYAGKSVDDELTCRALFSRNSEI